MSALTAPLRRLRLIGPLANLSGCGGWRPGGLTEVREKTAPVLGPMPTSCMAHILDVVIIMAETHDRAATVRIDGVEAAARIAYKLSDADRGAGGVHD
jgi:hypothetical protein